MKAAQASNREARAALGALTLGPFTSACFQSIAVTFGTATSSSIDVGFSKTEIRSSLLLVTFKTELPAQAETIHNFVITLDINAL